MPDKKKKEEAKKGSPEYMTTYGDMMTLLLCFFVMLLAMSTIDPNRFMVAASSFQNAFSGVLKEFPTIPIHKNILVPRMGGDEQNKRMAIEAVRQLQESLDNERPVWQVSSLRDEGLDPMCDWLEARLSS